MIYPDLCATCHKEIWVAETVRESFESPLVTKYWSYNQDGSIRPYCSCECGLKDFTENKNNEQTD